VCVRTLILTCSAPRWGSVDCVEDRYLVCDQEKFVRHLTWAINHCKAQKAIAEAAAAKAKAASNAVGKAANVATKTACGAASSFDPAPPAAALPADAAADALNPGPAEHAVVGINEISIEESAMCSLLHGRWRTEVLNGMIASFGLQCGFCAPLVALACV
jgi:hypothetical protein